MLSSVEQLDDVGDGVELLVYEEVKHDNCECTDQCHHRFVCQPLAGFRLLDEFLELGSFTHLLLLAVATRPVVAPSLLAAWVLPLLAVLRVSV